MSQEPGIPPSPSTDQQSYDAVNDIYGRFAPRIVALARRYVDRQTQGKFDPEDVLQSVCRSFFSGLRMGQITIRDEKLLWGLLARMTVRKCINRRAYFRMARRNVAQEIPLDHLDPEKHCPLTNSDPTPSAVAVHSESMSHLTNGLSDRDREIILFYLEGCSIREISHRTGRAERTVRRVLGRIKDRARRPSN